MKTISLWQPWASLVAIGAKRIETRDWATPYRGPLAIHAAKRWNKELQETFKREPFASALLAGGFKDAHSLPFGAVIATCELEGCVRVEQQTLFPGGMIADLRIPPPDPELSFGDYRPGRFAWILSNAKPLLKPIFHRGSQKFFDANIDIENPGAAIVAQQVEGGYAVPGVLGVYPTKEEAEEAAKVCAAIRAEPRLCSATDIEKARQQKRAQERRHGKAVA